MIDQAFDLAWRAHYGQFRLSNEPYVTHALATAQIVKEWGLGAEEMAAALCHDVVEDGLLNGNKINKEYVADLLGERVADLVDGITELGKEPDYSGSKPSKDYIFGKLLEAARKDPSVLIIKFADRLHNMRTLAYAKSESARKKAAETLYIYSRIADILGMWALKRDLEELAFEYLEPERYREIKTCREVIIKQSKKRVQEITDDLRKNFSPIGVKINCERRGVYELCQRAELKNKTLADISADDVWRVNVIVPEKPVYSAIETSNCHLAMSAIHKLFHPAKDHKIEDHIYEACPNGHRFLHTYVKVEEFGCLLVQIRDRQMYREYQGGVLAYIKGAPDWKKINLIWLDSLIRHLSSEYGVKDKDLGEIFAAESVPITVYTHKRNTPVQLPRGASVLDFAFRLFDKKALSAVGAKVNGHTGIPLSRVLKDGDIVHVDFYQRAQPGLEWLEWVRTPEAVDELKRYYASLGEGTLLSLAAVYLNGKLEKYHLSAAELLASGFFGDFLARHGLREPAEFLQKLGRGEIKNADKFLAEAIKELQAQFAGPQAPRVRQPFLIIAESRQGLLDKIANPMKDIANISVGFFHEYEANGKKMAAMTIYVECADSPAGELQLRRIRNIIDKTPGVTKCTSDQAQIGTSVHYFVEYIKKGN